MPSGDGCCPEFGRVREHPAFSFAPLGAFSRRDERMTAAVRPPRVRRHPIAKMYYRLRTRRDTPRQKALAAWLGVIVGCTPLFGLHLPICIAAARVTGVNFVTTYLASYANNPLVAPFTLYLSLGVGRWLFTGEWVSLQVDEVRAVSVWRTGRDVLIGSLLVGAAFGALLGALVYRFSRPTREQTPARQLVDNAARRYLDSGIFAWEFARGKLKHDPLYLSLLKTGALPRQGRLLDLGCGHGILLSILDSARAQYTSGQWQEGWLPPPELALIGIDVSPKNTAVARSALGVRAEIRVGDLRVYRPPPCEVATLFDVLHYLPADHQQALLERVDAALQPGGLLLIREADAAGGIRFTMTRLTERLAAWCRFDWRQGFCYRDIAQWTRLLESRGFTVKTRPMSAGTPFANVLIEARKV